VIVDPAGDEWRAFWLEAYGKTTQPKRPEIAALEAVERSPGGASVGPGEGG
jgi:hypothetical protein